MTFQTREKLKQAYEAEFAATIERAEKQIILAKHGRRLLELLDDTPVVPGDTRAAYDGGHQARQVLNDCEDDLKDWQPEQTYESTVQRDSPPLQAIKGGELTTAGEAASEQTDLHTDAGTESVARTDAIA